MPGYEGSLFDANGPMQFATQVRGIADALDSVNEKSQTFFSQTQQGLDNLTQSLSSFQTASGNFGPGGGGRGGGGSGWSVSSGVNNGGTGGQQGNTTNNGGSGNRPGNFESMTGGLPNGGFSTSKAVEAGIGVATGFGQNYIAQTQSPSIQQQLAAVQASLATGQSLSSSMYGIANNRMLATSQSDLAVGTATGQNLFGVTFTGTQPGLAGANQAAIGGTANLVNLMSGGIGMTPSLQSMGSMMSTRALISQFAMTGTMFRQGGQYNTPEAMVNSLFQRYPQIQTMDNQSLQQSLSPGAPLYNDIVNMAGGDPTMTETLINLVRARRNSGQALPTNMTGGQAKALGLTSPVATSQLQKQSSQSHMQAQLAQGQDQALTEFNRAMQSFYQSVNNLFGASPGAAGATGFGMQALGSFGGPLGSIVGMFTGGGAGGTGSALGGGGGGGVQDLALGALLGKGFGGGGGGGGMLGGGGGGMLDSLGGGGGALAFVGLSLLGGSLGDKLGTKTSKALGGNSSTGRDIGGGIGTAVGTVLGGPIGAAAGGFLGTTIGGLAPSLLAKIPKLIDDMSSVFDKGAKSAEKAVGGAVSDVTGAISGAVGDVGNFFGGIFGGGGSGGAHTVPALMSKTSSSKSGGFSYGMSSTPEASSYPFGPNAAGGSSSTGGAPGGSTGGASSKNPYWSIVQQAAQKYGVDPKLLSAQEYAESGWNPNAVSSAGAFGISQFMPSTAQTYGVQRGNSTAAVTSQIMGQASYMSALLQQFAGNTSSALSAYNAGPKGNWNNAQTKDYVSKIENYMQSGQYDRGSYEIERTKMALLHKGERVVRAADNTIANRWGGSSSGGGVHIHYHLAQGAVTVTMPSTDVTTAQKAGTAVADSMMERLAHA